MTNKVIFTAECVDVWNKEQLVICLRWVDCCLDVHEELLGLYHVPDTSANAITAAIKDCLFHLFVHLRLKNYPLGTHSLVY